MILYIGLSLNQFFTYIISGTVGSPMTPPFNMYPLMQLVMLILKGGVIGGTVGSPIPTIFI